MGAPEVQSPGPRLLTAVQAGQSSMSLSVRAVLFVLILACEKLPLDFLVNVDAAESATGLGAFVLTAQHLVFRFAVALALSLLIFAYAQRERRGWAKLNDAARNTKLRLGWILVHGAAILPLFPLSFFLYGRIDAPLSFSALVALWVFFAGTAVAALGVALAPWAIWWGAIREPGRLWLYAAVAAAIATGSIRLSQQLWASTAAVTFELVKHVLGPFIPGLIADPGTHILRSNRFAVEITDRCSGIEGAGMMLAFCGAWLLCFKADYRFPRALMLLPAGVILSFALNVIRIALLMLIGDRGYPEVAAFGFHSQAGWIAFILGAGLIAVVSLRSGWLSPVSVNGSLEGGRPEATESRGVGISTVRRSAVDVHNPTAAYLLPFLALLAAGMMARAASDGFEALYGLRIAACAVALAWAWQPLRKLDWHFSWRGLIAGIICFLVWVIAGPFLTHSQSMPAGLQALSVPARVSWIAIRVVAAITVVPIAEELAFRGYLMRRIVAANFDCVSFGSVSIAGLLASSLIFGVEHGTLWLPATFAGLIYGAVLMKTGKMGEAVLAHSTTAGLLALDVLLRGQWQLW